MRRAALLFFVVASFVSYECDASVHVFNVAGLAIPIYPGATRDKPPAPEHATIGDFGLMCLKVTVFQTNDAFIKVREYYRSVMPTGSEEPMKAEARDVAAVFDLPTKRRDVKVQIMISAPPPNPAPGMPRNTDIMISQSPPDPYQDPRTRQACAPVLKLAFPSPSPT